MSLQIEMEEDDLDFRATQRPELLTLEELSTIAVASQLCESAHLKQKLENFLNEYHPHWRKRGKTKIEKSYLEKLSPEITNAVSQIKLNNRDLPQILKIKIEDKVSELSERTFYWTMYLIQDLELDAEYAQKIYWTSNGLIDEDKIFKCFWMNLPVESHFEGMRYNRNLKILYYLACFFAQEEFIANRHVDIVKEINYIFPFEVDDKSDVTFDIMKVVMSYYDKFPTWNFSEHNLASTSNFEVLDICLSLCLHKAFVYFWEHLDMTERSFYVGKKFSTGLMPIVEVWYGKENLGLYHIAIFLMNEMNATQKNNFLFRYLKDLVLMFIKIESLQKFCIPVLDKFLPKLSSREVSSLLSEFVSNITHKDFHLEILKFLLQKMSYRKESVVYSVLCTYSPGSAYDLFSIPVLKVMINDEDLQDRRDSFIDLGREKFLDLIRKNDFQLLNQFMDEVLKSENERRKFKKDYNFINELIMKGQFDILANVLDWMHGDQAYKFKMGLKQFCFRLVPKCYNSAYKLIKFYFETEGEPLINSLKGEPESLKEFCRDLIYNIWLRSDFILCEDRALSIEVSEKILMSVFGSEEEILNFKNNELAKDESCVRIFCKNALKVYSGFSEASFDPIDQFLNFCGAPAEKIDAIKKLIAGDIVRWIEELTDVSWLRFVIVVPLLEWIYGSTSYNCKMLKHFFPDYHESLMMYYKNRSADL